MRKSFFENSCDKHLNSFQHRKNLLRTMIKIVQALSQLSMNVLRRNHSKKYELIANDMINPYFFSLKTYHISLDSHDTNHNSSKLLLKFNQ